MTTSEILEQAWIRISGKKENEDGDVEYSINIPLILILLILAPLVGFSLDAIL